MRTDKLQAYRAEIWHTHKTPKDCTDAAEAFSHLADGALIVNAELGTIVACEPYTTELQKKFNDAIWHDHRGMLITPGFIDTHLHFPQLDIIGSYGETLLGWLERYTFPYEQRFCNTHVATETAERLLTELLANGVTSAAIFSSSHKDATDTLFQKVQERGLRAIIGKVSMDQHAPQSLLSCPEQDYDDNLALLETWHGKENRLFYALTPRFAPTCSESMLEKIADLKEQFESVYVQTHHAENLEELAWVKELYPNDSDYLAVYERFNLLGERTILAHSIHVNDSELARIEQTQTTISHCPTSNLFLGSGLLPLRKFQAHDINLTLGSDIGGGTTVSMWRTMASAYQIQQLRQDYGIFSPVELFYDATLGAAKALKLEESIGNFATGKSADFVLSDPSKSRLLGHRFLETEDKIDRLFAAINLADDRIVEQVFIGGKQVFP